MLVALLAWPALWALAAQPSPSALGFDPPGVTQPSAEAAWRAAVALRDADDPAAAARAFEALADTYPTSRRAPQALAAAGTLARWRLGDETRAHALWTRALRGPDELPGVDAALNELLALERERRGAEGELRLIHTLVGQRKTAEYTPRLLLRAATVMLEELDQPARALAAARAAVERAEGTTWWDDAAMVHGKVLGRLGRTEEALAAYRRVIASHRETLLGGDENSDLLDDAYLAVAELLALDAERALDAEGAYLRLVDEVPHSPHVDDALARARALALARGDKAAAERHQARLAALRPGSRHLPRPR